MADMPENTEGRTSEPSTEAVSIGRPTLANRAERVSVVVACIAILGGFALFVYGEKSVGVGTAGVVNKLIHSIGMGLFGIGIIVVAIWLSKWLVASYVRLNATERARAVKRFFEQLLAVVLNVIVYGGVFVLALGAMAALDGPSIGTVVVVLVAWGVCIAAFVLYRRFRKKHKCGYGLVGYVAMPLALLALGLACVVLFFGQNASGAVKDLRDGPKTADVLLVQDKLDRPGVWYAKVVQTDHVLTFFTADGERVVLEVPDADIAQATVIDDYGDFVHLTYYPNTQVYCEATPWADGRQAIGEEMFQSLQEEYGFEIG